MNIKTSGKINISPGTSIYNGKVTVTSPGTAVQLNSSSVVVKGVIVKALTSNTGKIYVGDSSVISSTGYELNAKETISIPINNLNKVYIDSDNANEGVTYLGVN